MYDDPSLAGMTMSFHDARSRLTGEGWVRWSLTDYIDIELIIMQEMLEKLDPSKFPQVDFYDVFVYIHNSEINS